MNTRNALERGYLVFLISLISLVLLGGSAATGYLVGKQQAPASAASTELGSDAKTLAKSIDLATFWESWSTLDKKFYGELSTDKRTDGAISGMVAGLGDPYTVYLAPKQNKIFKSSIEGKFGGIGAELEIRNSLLTIVAPIQDTPAERAGLKAGDVILKIDGKAVDTMSFVDAIDAIRGEKDSSVTLNIARPNENEPFDVTLTRDTITIKSVKEEDSWNNQEYGYIRINQFGDDTSTFFQQYLEKILSENKKGIIIDLRNNPGGLVNKAVDMAGMLIPNKVNSPDKNLAERVVLRETFKSAPEEVYRATNKAIAPELPIVVLLNEGSASASEIFAGALRDHGRATLVGVKSFGKGSVQDLVPLKNGGSIKVTIAHWLTPKGTEINEKGITPDVEVALGKDEKISTNDAQVAKALELLSAGLKK